MKITVLTTSTAAISDLIHTYESRIPKTVGELIDLQLFDVENYVEAQIPKMKARIIDSQIVLLDLHGTPQQLNQEVISSLSLSTQFVVPINGERGELQNYFKLGSLSAQDLEGEKQHGRPLSLIEKKQRLSEKLSKEKLQDFKNYIKIVEYWRLAGETNMKSLLFFLLKGYGSYFGLSSTEKAAIPSFDVPKGVQETAIYNPITDQIFSSYEELVQHSEFDEKKPSVGIVFTNYSYPVRTTDAISEMMRRLQKFANVVPISYSRGSVQEIEKLRKFLIDSNGSRIDLLLNFVPFRLGAGPVGGNPEIGKQFLEELNVPVLHPFFITRRKREDWEASSQGVTSSEFSVSVMLPELDGNIETIPVGVMDSVERNEAFDVEIKQLHLIEDRAEKLVSRVEQWLNLRRKPNHQKKVAIIGYNYPPGEGNVFGGSFLDTLASLETIIKRLHKEGYEIPVLTKEQLQKKFVEGKIVNSPEWVSGDEQIDYIRYKRDKYETVLNDKILNDVEKEWGRTQTMMTDEGEFLIPGVMEGQTFIGLQPTRGIHENPEKSYHDKSLPPHHQYIAYYQWLKEEFKGDVIIHVGTHGTLEFLSGKECGMSGDCYPDLLVNDIPHLYLYYTGNPAEAMIAKRRSHAALISYQSPPFQESELYGELLPLETLFNEYHEVERTNPEQGKELEQKLMEKSKELHFAVEDIEELEKELYRIKSSLIPTGLHVFGTAYSEKEAADYMKFVLKFDRGSIKSLPKLIAESKQLNYDVLTGENNTKEIAMINEEVDQLIKEYVTEGKLCHHVFGKEELKQQITDTLQFGMEAYTASQQNNELEGLIKALNGEFIPARLGGDMVRDPSVFPTGCNLYQFDPRLVPSESAYERGKKVADQTIEKYLNKTGNYPDKVGVVLWGLETSRTQGETLGQILHYLGIKVIHRPGMIRQTYEIVPIEELGRPRIDVVLNISGMFRAMFPNMIEDLSDLFIQISERKETEEENFMKRNTNQILEQLKSEGLGNEEAMELASARIFGPSEEEYGTNVTSLIETKNWEEEAQIGQSYLNSLQHVYTKNHYGKPMKELLTTHLKKVEIISQIRSTPEHEVVDLDHYYEYFGGMSKSVENAKGAKAEVYISDTTTSQIETEDVEHAIARGVRTRITNPKWIDAMLEHDYHGVQKIAERFENILGLAATTNKVDNWIFNRLHSTYIENEELKKRCTENNRWAYLHMVETLLESNQRGYWEATEEQLNELRNTYLDLEGSMEETTV
ncbi:cobaltochelatase CobN [Evansella vedderi]|uniref:Cobaltochelatase CobN n=1 Tax=Evansella vedderi TaxID=38282 RepID=A0ABT9ZNG9_9BACI|nr:magnesium chelatase subunit H [Evansella vedderi]MDQ0252739.1 cobaltochelatase CobN [Evansella vedderi]